MFSIKQYLSLGFWGIPGVEIYILMSKYRVEANPQVDYGYFFHEKETHSMSYGISKITEAWQNITFTFVTV